MLVVLLYRKKNVRIILCIGWSRLHMREFYTFLLPLHDFFKRNKIFNPIVNNAKVIYGST